MDWTDVEVRRRFEDAISRWRQRRQGWTRGQTAGWAAALFGLNLVIVTLLYGGYGKCVLDVDILIYRIMRLLHGDQCQGGKK